MSQSLFSILVVCTANICRSPAGQSLLAAQLIGRSVRVESAGTRALDGNAIDATMARLLRARGRDALPGHRSRPLMPVMLSRYDLVLCMQDEHLERTLALYPAARGKVRLLGHWSAQQIRDPIGKPETDYLVALDQIESCATEWAQKLTDMEIIR